MLGQQHYKPKYNGRLCYTQPPIYGDNSKDINDYLFQLIATEN